VGEARLGRKTRANIFGVIKRLRSVTALVGPAAALVRPGSTRIQGRHPETGRADLACRSTQRTKANYRDAAGRSVMVASQVPNFRRRRRGGSEPARRTVSGPYLIVISLGPSPPGGEVTVRRWPRRFVALRLTGTPQNVRPVVGLFAQRPQPRRRRFPCFLNHTSIRQDRKIWDMGKQRVHSPHEQKLLATVNTFQGSCMRESSQEAVLMIGTAAQSVSTLLLLVQAKLRKIK
jgi:hypothetical protein